MRAPPAMVFEASWHLGRSPTSFPTSFFGIEATNIAHLPFWLVALGDLLYHTELNLLAYVVPATLGHVVTTRRSVPV